MKKATKQATDAGEQPTTTKQGYKLILDVPYLNPVLLGKSNNIKDLMQLLKDQIVKNYNGADVWYLENPESEDVEERIKITPVVAILPFEMNYEGRKLNYINFQIILS